MSTAKITSERTRALRMASSLQQLLRTYKHFKRGITLAGWRGDDVSDIDEDDSGCKQQQKNVMVKSVHEADNRAYKSGRENSVNARKIWGSRD